MNDALDSALERNLETAKLEGALKLAGEGSGKKGGRRLRTDSIGQEGAGTWVSGGGFGGSDGRGEKTTKVPNR